MDGVGPITNTRSVEDALRDAVNRLNAASPCAEQQSLLTEARRYQRIVAGWELAAPVPEEQFETIGEIMRLLATSLKVAPPRGRRRQAVDSTPGLEAVRVGEELELEDDEPSTPPFSPRARGARIEVPVAKEQPDGARVGEGALEVIHPRQRPWQPVPISTAVRLKVVSVEDDGSRRHLLVRLDDGASLQNHRARTVEVIQVVEGAVQVGEETIHAGSFLRVAAGALCPEVKAAGEATLLLIGSERSFSV